MVKILYLDDNKMQLQMISARLEKFYNYVVIQADDADNALKILSIDFMEKREIALVLSDYLMPVKTGIDFLRELVATVGNQYPFMLFTDMDTSSILQKSIKLGSGFSTKPTMREDFEMLNARIRETIEQHNLKQQECERKARNYYIKALTPMLDALATKHLANPDLVKDLNKIKKMLIDK